MPANPAFALSVMSCESGGRPHAHNQNALTGDDSVGLFQINLFGGNFGGRMRQLQALGYDVWDYDSTVAVLKQPEPNIRLAAHMSGGGRDFSQWSCAR